MWKQAALAVPAAALMLGQSQGGTTIGINFYGNSYGSYYGGRAVSATAFGISANQWYTTPAGPDTTAATNSMTAGPGGGLNLRWSAPYTGVSRVDSTNTPALSQGDADVYYGFLDGGQTGAGPGYSVSLSGLAALFPSGYVAQPLAATDTGVSFATTSVSDGITTTNLAYPAVGLTTRGGAYALGQGSGVFTGDSLSLSGPPSVQAASALAGFLLTDQPVVSARPSGGGLFSLAAHFSLQAGAVGIPPIAYQWRLNGAPIAGATNTTYNGIAAAARAGDYDLVATNNYGSATSVVATVQVVALPAITRDLRSQTNYQSMMAAFSVEAGGATPLGFQWSKGGVAITGAVTAALTLTNLQPSDSADYQVLVTNRYGAATSAVATLSVLPVLPPYEGFNYTNGLLTGLGSDTAWGGPWTQTPTGYNGDHAVVNPGATYQDGFNHLIVAGGAVELAASGSADYGYSGTEDYENIRSLLATLGGPSGGTIYFSFIGQVTNSTDWAGVELAQDGAGSLLLGANNAVPNWGWGDRGGANPACGYSTNSLETVSFLVYRFDFTPTNTLVQLYVNPALTAEPATASASGSWTNFQFNQVRLVSAGQYGTGIGPTGLIDELRLGGSWTSVSPLGRPLSIIGSGAGRSLVWTDGILQTSAALGVAAAWTNVPNATSPYPLPAIGRSAFYRLGAP